MLAEKVVELVKIKVSLKGACRDRLWLDGDIPRRQTAVGLADFVKEPAHGYHIRSRARQHPVYPAITPS